jgi:purine-nucleoside phosphorylase
MSPFEAVFGIKSQQVQKTCILLPLIPKMALHEFKAKKILRGKLYGVANAKDFTLIHTGIGAGFVGDAVLYLKETPCRNVILFSSCGLVKEKTGLSLGSLVSPLECYANESFSEMLSGEKREAKVFYPEQELFEDFLKTNQDAGVRGVTCSTISSLKLEEGMLGVFIAKGIEVVDMECSAFFAASDYVGLKAIALFFISDIIKERPFYLSLDPVSKLRLFSSIKMASRLLCAFIQKNPGS